MEDIWVSIREKWWIVNKTPSQSLNLPFGEIYVSPYVVVAMYICAALFVLYITLKIIKWVYSHFTTDSSDNYSIGSKTERTGRSPSPSSSFVSASDIIPTPVPEKVWGQGLFGKPNASNEMQGMRQNDDITIRTIPRYKTETVPSNAQSTGTKTPLTPFTTTTTTTTPSTVDDCPNKFFKRVEFRWFGKADKVYFTSNFLKWSTKVEMTAVMDTFLVCFDLPKGHYEFKFEVDGIWCISPGYKRTTNMINETLNYIHNY